VILDPTLDDSGIEQHVETIKSWIQDEEDEVIRADIWGRRRLAYPIGRCREGVFTFFVHKGKATTVTELARRFQIDEGILRHLTVRADRDIDESTQIGLSDAMDGDSRGRGRGDRRGGDRPFRSRRRDDGDDRAMDG
jgi:small subunit ribosomal protein S6